MCRGDGAGHAVPHPRTPRPREPSPRRSLTGYGQRSPPQPPLLLRSASRCSWTTAPGCRALSVPGRPSGSFSAILLRPGECQGGARRGLHCVGAASWWGRVGDEGCCTPALPGRWWSPAARLSGRGCLVPSWRLWGAERPHAGREKRVLTNAHQEDGSCWFIYLFIF